MDKISKIFFKENTSYETSTYELSSFISTVLVLLFMLGASVLVSGLLTFGYVVIQNGWGIGTAEDFGNFGSFYGGILGSFAASLSAIIFWVALRKQMMALNESNKLLAASESAAREATYQQKNLFRLEQLMKHLQETTSNLPRNLEQGFGFDDEGVQVMYHPIKGNREGGIELSVRALTDRSRMEKISELFKNDPLIAASIADRLKLLFRAGFDYIQYLKLGGAPYHLELLKNHLIFYLEPFHLEEHGIEDRYETSEVKTLMAQLADLYRIIFWLHGDYDQSISDDLRILKRTLGIHQ